MMLLYTAVDEKKQATGCLTLRALGRKDSWATLNLKYI